jgi:class 3 adenylate cyclase
MPGDRAELERRLADVESRNALLEERWRLNDEVDRLAEIAVRDRLPLDHAMRLLMPALCQATGARGAWVRTYAESLEMHDFVHGASVDAAPPLPFDTIAKATTGGSFRQVVGGRTIVAQRLDVAGDAFGAAAVFVDGALDDRTGDRIAALLDTFCEEIDNTLASIALARRKTIVIAAMSDALRDPVLDVGLRRAIAVLRDAVAFEDMLLVFRHEDDATGRSLRYRILKGGTIAHDSSASPDPDVDAFLRANASRLMSGDDAEVRERFGIRRHREEVLITGVQSARVIGRLIVTSRRGEFNTFDRDLLDRFADFLRQRIVDYNKEWKNLASTFSRAVSERLLREEGYRDKYLTARDRECAVMFCDISGFTRVCEQVLVRPEAIGRLVDTWSERVVEIVWDTGGVFDKMVGDCVIGIWGPPFFDRSPRDLCAAAIDASQRIRDFTRSISTHPALPELAKCEGIDVATGLNWCPLFVGIFGPDEDYTGFSAGMNNTARLQGQAKGGDIFCMDTLVERIGDDSLFGEWREAKVKNVEHPLRFRPLR